MAHRTEGYRWELGYLPTSVGHAKVAFELEKQSRQPESSN